MTCNFKNGKSRFIDEGIQNYAIELDLDWIDYGGGLDYICPNSKIENNWRIIIAKVDDCGSPDSLDSPAEVYFFHDDDCESATIIRFNTTWTAMRFLWNMTKVVQI